ncbi:SIR2 family protein [Paenibacillus dauci]|uniref:SIR2 family protein n=1 Tax=Paenibacillus dauci TaxID=1567106 RepID=UPI000619E970|nr:SIR2 family protein [Paenibacillus dauci]
MRDEFLYKREKIKHALKVQDAAKQGNLAFFVGAGVSRLSSYPSWNELVYEFDQKLKEQEQSESSVYDDTTFDSFQSPPTPIQIDEPSKSVPFYTSEQLLRIPEKMAAIDKEEYKRIVAKVFDNPSIESNGIHSRIASFDPHYILTTNYDHLIEEAWRKRFNYINVISSDKHISSATSARNVIKIHGGFERTKNGFNFDPDQVVLKESDYFNYDKNFALIRNMTRTILATHVVVFVGYGLQDYNINLLFNWVKDIQKEKYINPIFINVDHTPTSTTDIRYYENRGIDIIDACLLDVKDKEDYFGRYDDALQFLLKADEFSHDLYNYESLNLLYDSLLPVFQLNSIKRSDFKKLLGIEDDSYEVITSGNEENISNYLSSLTTFYNEGRYKDDKHKLRLKAKAIIDALQRYDIKTSYSWDQTAKTPFMPNDPSFYSDYDALQQLIDAETSNPKELFFKAAAFYTLGELRNSYALYNDLIKIEYALEDQWILYFSQLNIAKLYSMIVYYNQINSLDKTEPDSYSNFENAYKREMEGFTQEVLFNSMPYDFKKTFHHLKSLSDPSFVEKEAHSIFTDCMTLEYKNDLNEPFYSRKRLVDQIYNKTIESIRDLFDNGIHVRYEEECSTFVQKAFYTLFSTFNRERNLISNSPHTKDVYKINSFDFICLCKYFNSFSLGKMEENFHLSAFELNEAQKIEKYLYNLIKLNDFIYLKVVSEKKWNFMNRYREIISAFYLYSHFNISHDVAVKIIQSIFKIPKILFLFGEMDDMITRIIVKQPQDTHHQFGTLIEERMVTDLLRCKNIIDEPRERYFYSLRDVHPVLNPQLTFDQFSSEVLNLKSDQKEGIRFATIHYAYLSAKAKEYLNSFEELTPTNYEELDFLLVCKTISLCNLSSYENMAIDYIQEHINLDYTNPHNRIVPYLVRNIGRYALFGHFKSESFFPFKNQNAEFDFLIDPMHFDYKLFDPMWLLAYEEEVHLILAMTPSVRNQISLFKKQALQNDKLIELFVTYYL